MQQESHAHKTLNTETLEAMSELEEGGGELFTGSTEDFFKMLTESDD